MLTASYILPKLSCPIVIFKVMKIFRKILGQLFSYSLFAALLLTVVLTPVAVKAQEATPSAALEPSATSEPSTAPAPSFTPEPSATPSATLLPQSSAAPIPAPTIVSVSTTYSSTDGKAKVKFNSISGTAGGLTISETILSSSQASKLGALSSTVYDISSGMNNGSFSYDLTLPLPEGVNGNNFKVKYATSVDDLDNAQEVGERITINNDGTFTIHNLNHFTVFVVVNPNTQANCDAVALGTTSGTTCFSTIQEAVDASSNGDTITIGAGTYNETVNVSKQLTFNGQGDPVVTAFVLQTTPSTFTGITAGSTTIATPTVSLTNPVFSGNQTNVTISGTGAANATVNYTITGTSGSVSGTGAIASDGTINIGVIDVSSLPDGDLTLSATLSFNSYSSSAATATSSTDTQAPSMATNLSITNPIHSSNQTTIALSGNGEANSTANWTISNGAFSVSGTSTVSGGGTFSANTINVSSLSDGTLTLSVTLTDTAGNTNSAATTTTNKDTTAPTLTTVAISSSNANNSFARVGDTVNLIFTSSESVQTPVVSIAGHLVSPTNTSGNNWLASYTLTSQDTEEVISFEVNFTDTVGNAGVTVTSTTNSSFVTFDQTAPTLSSTTVTTSNSNPSFAKVGDVITVSITTSEAVQTPIINIAGQTATVTGSGTTWSGTYTVASTDPEGLISYTISYGDLAGNTGSPLSTNSSITLDKTTPTLSGINVSSNNPNSSFAKTGDTVTLTFTSDETIQTPAITIAGQTATVTGSGTSWSATYNMQSSDTEGLIAYSINFQDQAGNSGTSSANSSVAFDKTVPTITSQSLSSSNANSSFAKVGDTVTLNITSSENIQTPTITIANHSVTASGSGSSWLATYTLVSGDNEGLISYTVAFTDLAGNTGTPIDTSSQVTFDKTSPSLSGITVSSSNTNPAFAKVGDVVTLTFISSETIQTPLVTIAGNSTTATNTSGNSWTASYTMTSSDPEGLIAYTVSYQDLASNAGTSVNTNSTITFDRTNPTLTSTNVISSNANAFFAKVGDTITVTITSSETIQTPTITIAGHAVTAANTSGNTWTATYIMQSTDTEGLISYTINFQDLAENAGTTVNTNSTITFDKTAPTPPIVAISDPVNNANKTNITIVGTGEANSSVSFTIQDGASNQVSGSGIVDSSGNILISNIDVTSLVDGSLGLFVYLTDPAGNLSTAGLDTSNKDTVNPAITVSSVTTSNSNPGYARVGDTVTLNFSTSETVNTPAVTIAGQTVSANNTSGNNWTAIFTLTSTDTEGLISYTINATDLSNNSATPVVANSTITFDKTAPAVPTVSLTNPVNNSNKTSVAISGTGEANASFTWNISDGTNSVSGTGSVNGLGNISITGIDASGLNDGTLTVSVALTDQAGNTGSAGTSTATKDTVAPTLTAAVSTSNTNPTFAKAGDTITVTFISAEPIQTPVVTIAGNSATVTNTSGNTWTATYTMTSSDTEGLIAYTIAFTDTAGNSGTPVNTNSAITFDKTNPSASVVTISSSNSNPSLAKVGDTIILTFTSSETIQSPSVTIAGQTASVSGSGTSWTATYIMQSSDTEGLIAYVINFQDLAGNTGTNSGNSTVTFDKTNPTLSPVALISSNSNPNYAKVGDTLTIAFTSSESIQTPTVTIAGQSVTATNSGNNWTATYLLTSSDTEGLIPYTVNFSDSAGNDGSAINTNSAITFDQTAPITPSVSLTNPVNSTNQINIAISGTGEANATFTYTITDGTNTVSGTGTVSSEGNITTSGIDVSSLSDQTLTLSVTLTDQAGNTGSVGTSTATKDTAVPTITSTSVTSSNANPNFAKIGDTLTLTFTSSETIQNPTVTIAGQSVTATNTSGNNWSATYILVAEDIEGLISYSIAFTDTAGNIGTPISTTSSIAFDKTAPSGSWISPAAGANVSGIVTLEVTASDTNSTTITLSYKRNDGVDTFHDIAGTSWDTNTLVLDNYTLRLTITDNTGNVTIVEQTVGVATVISTSTIQTTNTTESGVVINWTTDDPTSSRVIYDTVSHLSLGSTPNYGYASSTANFDTSPKVTNHSVTLTGLSASTVYYYRVVSAGSPEAVSSELSFTSAAVSISPVPGSLEAIHVLYNTSAPICGDPKPGSAPALLSAKITGRNQVTLIWSKAKDPVTYYLIEYGTGHDKYQFGVPNVGNVTSFVIDNLTPGVTYYFRVRAGNSCMPGEFSNELVTKNDGSFVAEKIVEVVSSALGVTNVSASSDYGLSRVNDVTAESATESATSSEASASTQPAYLRPSPVSSIKGSGSSNLVRNIALTGGIIVLLASAATYYTTLKKKV